MANISSEQEADLQKLRDEEEKMILIAFELVKKFNHTGDITFEERDWLEDYLFIYGTRESPLGILGEDGKH